MNYKTTLVIAAIAAAAFVAIGSVSPVLESAYAQNSNNTNTQGVNNQGACTGPCAGNIAQQGANNFQQNVGP